MGSQPDGRIYRPSSEHTISRRTISVLPMGIVHNARNCTVASRKYICTIHDQGSSRRSVLQSHAIHRSQPQTAQATHTPPSFLHCRRCAVLGPMGRIVAAADPWLRCRGRNADDWLRRIVGPSVRQARRPTCKQKSRMRHSPGQLHHAHSDGLFQWRVTGSPLLYHTDCLFVGIPDLASTPVPAVRSSLSDRLHPAKVIRYFHRTPRETE